MTKLKALKYIMPLVATLLMGCGPSGSSFVIKGSFEDMEGAELYIYNLSDDNAKYDTITVAGGEFIYKGECKETTPYMLVFSNAVEQVIFVSPGKEIKYNVSSNDLKNYNAIGTDENKLMNSFREETNTLTAKQTQVVAERFIKENSSSIVAIYLFDRYFVQNRETGFNDIRKVLNILKTSQPKNEYLLNIENGIKNLEAMSKGKVIPNVGLKSLRHSKVKLWDSKKDENTLILFWASWASGSYDMLWKMRDLVRKDSVPGRFVGISYDVEFFRFESDCKVDSANGIEQYCDGLAFESPVARRIGIPSIPYYVITDKKHKVVASGTQTDQMAKDVTKWMKKGNEKKK